MIRDLAGPVPTATLPRATAPAATEAPPARGITQPQVPMLNPRMRIDTELNLVVLEFRDDAGELRNSIPSPRELDAYRLAAREADSPLPPDLDLTR